MAHNPARTNDQLAKERIDLEFNRNKVEFEKSKSYSAANADENHPDNPNESVRNRLKLKSLEAQNSFNEKYPHVQKFFNDRGAEFSKIRHHSAKVITSTALTGAMLLTPTVFSTAAMPTGTEIVKNINEYASGDDVPNIIPLNQVLTRQIKDFLPEKVGPLSRTQEKNLEKIFSEVVGVDARANLEGEHLNTTYGYIGAEQHLKRYPGDTIGQHSLTPDDEGIAPGLGGFGYFAKSKSELTQSDIEREKWYAVVQTLYLPDWKTRLRFLVNWYKYRKVLIVNTVNGNAVVADIADAGPAAWTGKHFGGSPEVMNYLGGSRYKKGPVVVFFVDDPDNKVPLGPVEYNKFSLSDAVFKEF